MASRKRKRGRRPRIIPEKSPCAACAGKGRRLVYRGEQLRAFREHFGYGLIDLAQEIENPNTGHPVSIAFLSNVERGLPGYPCPEWLYLAYLAIPGLGKEKM